MILISHLKKKISKSMHIVEITMGGGHADPVRENVL